MPVPTITLSNGDAVPVIDSKLINLFGTYPPPIQRKAIRILEEFTQEIYANGSLAHLLDLKVITEAQLALQPGHRANGGKLIRLEFLDKCNWQLAQLLRYSTPSRIMEAVGPLTVVLNAYRTFNGDKKVDVVPNLYLAVALSKVAGEETRAIETYKLAVDNLHSGPLKKPQKNLIWAMANMAHLFRRLDRIPEAEEQEKLAREWILGHPYSFPPSEIRSVFHNDDGTGIHILDHPSITKLFGTIVEVAPGVAIVSEVLPLGPQDHTPRK